VSGCIFLCLREEKTACWMNRMDLEFWTRWALGQSKPSDVVIPQSHIGLRQSG
jgi:hypothetical protein